MILPILKKGDVCSYIRLLLPFKYGGWWKEEFDTEQLDSLLSKASVVIFNRYFGEDIIHLLKAKKKYGFKIITDLDDFWELYPNHVAYKGWQNWDMAQRTRESIMNSDFVIVTTKRLADVVLPLNKNIEVIPNALPFGDEPFINDREPIGERIRFLSAGGKTHYYDLKQIEPCLKKLNRLNRGQYELVMAGHDQFDKDGVWDKIEGIFKNNTKHYTRIYRLPLESYINCFNNGDVVLAPLETNYFNQFKSQLRVLEAGCKEMPIITSNYPPYSDEPTDLIMKASTTNEWYNHIKYCIDNPNFIIDKGKELGRYVRKYYNLQEVNIKRREVFDFLSSK